MSNRRREEVREAEEAAGSEERSAAGPASEDNVAARRASPLEQQPGGGEPAEESVETMPQAPASPAPALGGAEPSEGRAGGALDQPRGRRWKEQAIAVVLFLASAVSILTTIGIIIVLVTEAAGFFAEVSVVEFLTGTDWAPLFQPARFGVLPLLVGSLLISAIAAVFALPVGLASAIYLSEYASERVRRVIKPALEVLAGIPTVVYGYFALTFMTPLLENFFPGISVFNALSAGLVVGILILPMVASLSEDALSSVPRALREGAYALGATKLEVATRTVVPAATSGIVASFILAVSRAIGETMIVTIAAGARSQLTLNPLKALQTMTAYMAQVAQGEVVVGTIEYKTIFAVGLLLFVITLAMNVASIFVVRRFREVYE